MKMLFAAHLDIEFKIFGYGYFVFRVCHGNIFLSLPRGYVLIEVGIQLIFVFEYGSFFHRRNGKFHLHVSFVQRSEEHTSELQSRQYLVCRLLLEKKKNYK